jgi:predicted nucleic acid-binding Zn ribbon protein
MPERLCVQCGCFFDAAGNQKVCSDECKEERLQERKRGIAAKMTILRRVLEAERIYPTTDRLVYSENFIEAILAAGCTYCGANLSRFTGICLDRIRNDENGKPGKHTSNNICACCPQCNETKSDNYSFEEMAILRPALVVIRIRRGNTHLN